MRQLQAICLLQPPLQTEEVRWKIVFRIKSPHNQEEINWLMIICVGWGASMTSLTDLFGQQARDTAKSVKSQEKGLLIINSIIITNLQSHSIQNQLLFIQDRSYNLVAISLQKCFKVSPTASLLNSYEKITKINTDFQSINIRTYC